MGSAALKASLVGFLLGCSQPGDAQVSEELVRGYLWPSSDAEFQDAQARLATDRSLVGVSRMQMHDLEEMLRRGPAVSMPDDVAGGGRALDVFIVNGPGGRDIPVYVLAPSRYTPDTEWPLMFAMHGGPPGGAEAAQRGALGMVEVWADAAERAGWIVASPAMVHTAAGEGRTAERLPYEIFHEEEAKAVIDAVRARYRVSPDRIVSTGISLGSNFSIGYGAAHPDWFSAIVPVSTEGDSRELLLRNLASVPVYVLEGSQDPNIRGVDGPRALSEILTSFGYDLTYREFGDRAHEGFQEHYADVLRWLDLRPRRFSPREILRVPHSGIIPVARRVHWVESNTRQGVIRARAVTPTRIEVASRWTGELTLFLSDPLVDLDERLEIWVNGARVFAGTVERSIRTALEEAKALGDERRVYAARVTVSVPGGAGPLGVAKALSEELRPRHPEGRLSFWEMYAQRALEERFPDVGFGGEEVPLPRRLTGAAPEQVGIRITDVEAGGAASLAGLEPGDVLITVGGEPFFQGRGGVFGLHQWMVRELRTTPAEYELTVWRDGRETTLSATYGLGPYRPARDDHLRPVGGRGVDLLPDFRTSRSIVRHEAVPGRHHHGGEGLRI